MELDHLTYMSHTLMIVHGRHGCGPIVTLHVSELGASQTATFLTVGQSRCRCVIMVCDMSTGHIDPYCCIALASRVLNTR